MRLLPEFRIQKMPKFHVKKISLGDDQSSLIFKGKVLEGLINQGMSLQIPITEVASIDVKIHDILHFENQNDEFKKVGLVVDFYGKPDDLDVILGLRIAEEELLVL